MSQKFKLEFISKVLEVVEENHGHGLERIATEFNLTSGAPILRWWIKRYNNVDLQSEIARLKTEEQNMKNQQNKMTAEEELALLKKEMKALKHENEKNKKEAEKFKKQAILHEAKLEIIKKSKTTCLQTDMVAIMKTKEFKHYAYQKISTLTCMKLVNVREACRFFGVGSPDKYYLFVKKHNLPTPANYDPNMQYSMKPYSARQALKASELVDMFYKEFPNTAASAESIRFWIIKMYPWFQISVRRIREIQRANPNKRPRVHRKQKSKKGLNKLANVRFDLIGHEYVARRVCEKIGMDGTWFKVRIKGFYIKLLLEVAYDWYSREIVSYTWSSSENTEAVCSTFQGILNYVGSAVEQCIVQMDRGSANRSYALLDLEKSQEVVTISMSESGFKHNSPTESMNGWIKDKFFEANGKHFESILDFKLAFKKFVSSHNQIQQIKYNNVNIILNVGTLLV